MSRRGRTNTRRSKQRRARALASQNHLDQLLSEYLKALPDLMIDESLKLKDELEKKQNEIELLKQNQDERILLLEAKQKEIAEHLKNLKS